MNYQIHRRVLITLLCCLFSTHLFAQPKGDLPTVAFKGVKLSSVDLSGVAIQVVLDVHNPGEESLTVTGLTYQFSIATAPAIEGDMTVNEVFKAKASREVNVPIKLPYGPSATTVMQLLSSTAPTPYKIKGSLSLLGDTPKYDYSHEGELPPISTDMLTKCCTE